MTFGLYLPSVRPSESNAPLYDVMKLLQMPGKCLEAALLVDADQLLNNSQKLLELLKSASTDAPTSEYQQAVGLWGNAHAKNYLTHLAEDVIPQVQEAHQLAHQHPSNPKRFCAQTTRLLAREEARLGNFTKARDLFEQIESERDPGEAMRRDPSFYLDPIELALLRILMKPEEAADLPSTETERLRRSAANAWTKLSDSLHVALPDVQESVAKDLMWLCFHYARYPALVPEFLSYCCSIATKHLQNLESNDGVIESLRLLSALALERGQFKDAGFLSLQAARYDELQNDPLSKVELLYSAGQAFTNLGGAHLRQGMNALREAHRIACDQRFGPMCLEYQLVLVEALIKSWRVDEAKEELRSISKALDDESNEGNERLGSLPESLKGASSGIIARWFAVNAGVVALEDGVAKAGILMARAHAECVSDRDSVLTTADNAESTSDIRHRLNHLQAREALPYRVANLELSIGAVSQPDVSELSETLEAALRKDRSPWTAELLARLHLVQAREKRMQGLVTEALVALKRPTELLQSYPKLQNSVLLSEVLLERGLNHVQQRSGASVNSALRCLDDAAQWALKFDELGDGIQWAADAAISLIYSQLRQEPERARDFAARAATHEARIKSLGRFIAIREYLDSRYQIRRAFLKEPL